MKLKTLRPRLAVLSTPRLPAQHTERLRGRAAVDRRSQWLYLHPLCVECDKEGLVTVGQEVDHIVPLWMSGADDYEANGQTLCRQHHDAKTTAEAAQRARGG